MSKVKKMKSQVEDAVKVITKEELENVKHLNSELQKHCNTIGAMEVQKAKAIIKLICLKKIWKKLRRLLKQNTDLLISIYLMEVMKRL